MSEAPPQPQLMRSLGHLVRGLSCLFWGLPVTLIVCFHTVRLDTIHTYGVIPPLVCTGLLVYGLWIIGDSQRQERVWRNALDRARLLGLMLCGLSPFLYWLNRIPTNEFFLTAVLLFGLVSITFLVSLNLMLRRLAAMLPDESLRVETRQFTQFNLNLLFITLLFGIVALALQQTPHLPKMVGVILEILERASFWFLVLLVLLPLAMTMALIWKTKEVILEGVFHSMDDRSS